MDTFQKKASVKIDRATFPLNGNPSTYGLDKISMSVSVIIVRQIH